MILPKKTLGEKPKATKETLTIINLNYEREYEKLVKSNWRILSSNRICNTIDSRIRYSNKSYEKLEEKMTVS